MSIALAGVSLIIVHIDALISLVVVGRHREGGLIGVNGGFAAADLAVVVAGEVPMEFPKLEGVAADEGRKNEEDADDIVSIR